MRQEAKLIAGALLIVASSIFALPYVQENEIFIDEIVPIIICIVFAAGLGMMIVSQNGKKDK